VGHPHFGIPEASIEIMEIHPLPGMERASSGEKSPATRRTRGAGWRIDSDVGPGRQRPGQLLAGASCCRAFSRSACASTNSQYPT
jgi:hypothetical protein